MTNAFWVALAALTALALAFVLYPLFFASRAQRDQGNRRDQNLENYRQRLAELQADRDEGRIDDATFGVLKDELDAALLEDVGSSTGSSSGHAGGRGDRRGVLVVVLVGLVTLPVLSLGLYERWGASDAVAQAEAMRSIEQGGDVSPEELERMLTDLRAHLEQNPDNADGWALLGRTNMQLQRYQAAAESYEGLARALGEEPVAATAWGLVAQARYLASQRQWNESLKAAIEKARAINPDEVNSLGLLGISAFERQNYARAANYWTRILQVAPDYPQFESIANGVASAYRAMDKEMPPEVQQLLNRTSEGGDAGAQDVSAASVQVRVILSDELAEPNGDASVFVFARAVDGPSMPLAVARLKVSDLPVTVTLDDTQAMTPEARLSSADKVVLGARVSTSGSATPAPGDLEGMSEPIAVAEDMGTVTLTIDSERP